MWTGKQAMARPGKQASKQASKQGKVEGMRWEVGVGGGRLGRADDGQSSFLALYTPQLNFPRKRALNIN